MLIWRYNVSLATLKKNLTAKQKKRQSKLVALIFQENHPLYKGNIKLDYGSVTAVVIA